MVRRTRGARGRSQQLDEQRLHEEPDSSQNSRGVQPFVQGLSFDFDSIETRLNQSLRLSSAGDLSVYAFVDPARYGLGGDLTLRPYDNLGMYLSGQFAGKRDWQVTGGVKMRW